jgi:hypothetical protein
MNQSIHGSHLFSAYPASFPTQPPLLTIHLSVPSPSYLQNNGFSRLGQAYNARKGSTYTLAATRGCGLSVSGTGQNPRWCSMMTPLLILWAGLTVVLIVLLIYRSTLSMHEDDQLFLGNSEAHMAKEQQDLIVKMNRIEPWVKVCGAGSALLFFVIAGIMLYSRFNI